MIELAIVRRMLRRGLILGPVAVAALWAYGGPHYAVSCATGIALALANLWFAGRVIGGLAENRPELLMAGGAASFLLGLAFLTAAAVLVNRVELVNFTVFGLSLICAHLGLAMWEAADAFLEIGPKKGSETEVPVTKAPMRRN